MKIHKLYSDMKNLVFEQDGRSVTYSSLVAEKFQKRHSNVLRDIECLECSDEFKELNFEFSLKTRELHNGGFKNEQEYIITRDGFTFLAMGFTGQKAAKFKEEFINEFNRLEQQVKSGKPQTKEAQWLEAMQSLHSTVQEQQKIIEKQAPKVQYATEVLQSSECYTTTTIAKEFGMSAKGLNQLLYHLGIQYFHDGHWVLYAQHQNKGFTKTRTHIYYNNDERRTSINTVWTERGRGWIHLMVNKNMSNLKVINK